MTNLILPIILQIVGIVVILAEFLVPSFGILTVLAVSLITWSLVQTFTEVSTFAGTVMVGADLLLLPFVVLLGIKIIGRSPFALRLSLSRESGVTSQSASLIGFLGKSGVVVTPLRPAGMAEIEGHRVDVVSQGEFIEKDIEVFVTDVTGNQVVVTRHPSHSVETKPEDAKS